MTTSEDCLYLNVYSPKVRLSVHWFLNFDVQRPAAIREDEGHIKVKHESQVEGRNHCSRYTSVYVWKRLVGRGGGGGGSVCGGRTNSNELKRQKLKRAESLAVGEVNMVLNVHRNHEAY